MAKTASNKSDATVWTTVTFASDEGKALKARLTALNAEAKSVKQEIEALARTVLPVPAKGFELVFSHRFGLGYAVLPVSKDTAPAKAKGPAI